MLLNRFLDRARGWLRLNTNRGGLKSGNFAGKKPNYVPNGVVYDNTESWKMRHGSNNAAHNNLWKNPPSPNCVPDGVLAKDNSNCTRHCENSVICNWLCANRKMNSGA